MKNIISILSFLLIICSATFAQEKDPTARYSELLQKGKAAEQSKEYAYALGYYYDATEEQLRHGQNINFAEESYKCFTDLAQVIKDGKPGQGEFDEFSLYNAWLALCQNTEKYWTEYPPYIFDFKISKEDVNFKTKTATYKVSGDFTELNKYKEIMDNTILVGFEKAYRNDWDEMSMNWPKISSFSDNGNYLQNGAALLKGPVNKKIHYYDKGLENDLCPAFKPLGMLRLLFGCLAFCFFSSICHKESRLRIWRSER